MSLPLYLFLFLYLLIVAIFVSLYLINLYHILSTGSITIISVCMSFFVALSMGTILFFTFAAISDVAWQQQINIFNASWLSNITNPSSSGF